MKTVFVILIILLASTASFAQSAISKGSFTLGGSISFSSESYEVNSDNQNIFKFNPQFGYFFVDQLYAALSVDYTHYSMGGNSMHNLGFGPAIRYYFDADKLKPFLGLGFLYGESGQSNFDGSVTNTEWKLTAGADYFITNNFAIEASLNYSFINYKYPSEMYWPSEQKVKKFNIGVGVNYFIY